MFRPRDREWEKLQKKEINTKVQTNYIDLMNYLLTSDKKQAAILFSFAI